MGDVDRLKQQVGTQVGLGVGHEEHSAVDETEAEQREVDRP